MPALHSDCLPDPPACHGFHDMCSSAVSAVRDAAHAGCPVLCGACISDISGGASSAVVECTMLKRRNCRLSTDCRYNKSDQTCTKRTAVIDRPDDCFALIPKACRATPGCLFNNRLRTCTSKDVDVRAQTTSAAILDACILLSPPDCRV